MEPDRPKYATDRESLERDSEVAFFTAGGPGGQHRNRSATGVRLTHRPSGITVIATERRSQASNRDMAFERLAARLQALQRVARPRHATKPSKASVERRREIKQRHASLKRSRRQKHDE